MSDAEVAFVASLTIKFVVQVLLVLFWLGNLPQTEYEVESSDFGVIALWLGVMLAASVAMWLWA